MLSMIQHPGVNTNAKLLREIGATSRDYLVGLTRDLVGLN